MIVPFIMCGWDKEPVPVSHFYLSFSVPFTCDFQLSALKENHIAKKEL